MQNLVTKLAHLLIFSSLYMGLGAVCMTLLSFELLGYSFFEDGYIGFVFCSSVFLYCLHRVVGIEKVKAFEDAGRFSIISKYRRHIWVYGSMGLVGSIYFFLQLERSVQLLLLVPGVVSLLYALPVFPAGRRLRDFPFVKLFLVGGVWGWITMGVPVLMQKGFSSFGVLAILGQVFFFLASALPFDVRDRKVDMISGVKTIPSVFGVRVAKNFSVLFLCCFVILAIYMIEVGYFEGGNNLVWSFLIYGVSGLVFMLNVTEDKPHLYYTVFMDGTLIMLPWIVCLAG